MTRRLGPGDDHILRALETAYERPIPAGGEILADERAHVLTAFDGDEPVGYALLYVLPHIDGRSMVFLYDEAAMALYASAGASRGADQVLWEWAG